MDSAYTSSCRRSRATAPKAHLAAAILPAAAQCAWSHLAIVAACFLVGCDAACLIEPDGNGTVVIPGSATNIGDYAFYECDNLTSITIPDSVTSIGIYAFHSCSSLASITIPDSVTSIGHDSFYRCTSLASVSIPGSVISIGVYAFAYCSSLASIAIPGWSSVTSIGEGAFRYCTSLTSVKLPDSVTSIGERAFVSCSSLVSVVIPDSVTSIGGDAFTACGCPAGMYIAGTTLVNCVAGTWFPSAAPTLTPTAPPPTSTSSPTSSPTSSLTAAPTAAGSEGEDGFDAGFFAGIALAVAAALFFAAKKNTKNKDAPAADGDHFPQSASGPMKRQRDSKDGLPDDVADGEELLYDRANGGTAENPYTVAYTMATSPDDWKDYDNVVGQGSTTPAGSHIVRRASAVCVCSPTPSPRRGDVYEEPTPLRRRSLG